MTAHDPALVEKGAAALFASVYPEEKYGSWHETPEWSKDIWRKHFIAALDAARPVIWNEAVRKSKATALRSEPETSGLDYALLSEPERRQARAYAKVASDIGRDIEALMEKP